MAGEVGERDAGSRARHGSRYGILALRIVRRRVQHGRSANGISWASVGTIQASLGTIQASAGTIQASAGTIQASVGGRTGGVAFHTSAATAPSALALLPGWDLLAREVAGTSLCCGQDVFDADL
jgi:hypothetical protein